MKNSPWFATHSLNCWCYECQQTVWKNIDGKTKTDCEIIGRRRTKHQIVIFWQHMKLDAKCWISFANWLFGSQRLEPRAFRKCRHSWKVLLRKNVHFVLISVSHCNVCRRCIRVKNNPQIINPFIASIIHFGEHEPDYHPVGGFLSDNRIVTQVYGASTSAFWKTQLANISCK